MRADDDQRRVVEVGHCGTFAQKFWIKKEAKFAGFEQIGLSRQTFSPYEFTLQYRDSVHYRGRMNIHNYPNLLLTAGYKVERFEIFDTGHMKRRDFKMVAFVARRDDKIIN